MHATLAPRLATHVSASRLDLYMPIHKAMRNFMADTLLRIGRIDVFDDEDIAQAVAQLEELLDFCATHVKREDTFLHPAIEAHLPSGASRAAEEHDAQRDSLDVLHNQALALRTARPEARGTLALRLYRHLALFIAENHQHMHVEETSNNAVLWSHLTDDDLRAVRARLMSTVSAAELLRIARWMVPALSPAERAAFMNGLQATLPADTFGQVLDTVQPHIDGSGWMKLMRALGRTASVKYA